MTSKPSSSTLARPTSTTPAVSIVEPSASLYDTRVVLADSLLTLSVAAMMQHVLGPQTLMDVTEATWKRTTPNLVQRKVGKAMVYLTLRASDRNLMQVKTGFRKVQVTVKEFHRRLKAYKLYVYQRTLRICTSAISIEQCHCEQLIRDLRAFHYELSPTESMIRYES
jgi:hypothetical protein